MIFPFRAQRVGRLETAPDVSALPKMTLSHRVLLKQVLNSKNLGEIPRTPNLREPGTLGIIEYWLVTFGLRLRNRGSQQTLPGNISSRLGTETPVPLTCSVTSGAYRLFIGFTERIFNHYKISIQTQNSE